MPTGESNIWLREYTVHAYMQKAKASRSYRGVANEAAHRRIVVFSPVQSCASCKAGSTGIFDSLPSDFIT